METLKLNFFFFLDINIVPIESMEIYDLGVPI